MKYLLSFIFLCLLCCAGPGITAGWEEAEEDRRGFSNTSVHARLEIGTKDGDQTLDLIRWPGLDDSVCFFIELGTDPIDITFPGDTTLIEYSDFDNRFYMIDNTALEWELIFDSKPGSQYSWSFPFISDNLVFYYQDSLDAEPGTIYFAHGSWAVYHSYKSGNFVSVADTAFKIGKAFHIDRPKAWDSSGDTVWFNMVIDTLTDSLTISGDSAWLDTSDYPITIDPTFGYTDAGASSTGLNNATASLDNPVTASTGDIIVSFHFHGNGISGGDAEMAAYTNAFGSVDDEDRLDDPVVWEPTGGSPSWQESQEISQEMANGVAYSPALGEYGPGQNEIAVSFDGNGGTSNDKGSTNRLLDPFVLQSSSAAHYSIYATYTEGAEEEVTPTFRRREERRR